MSSKTLSFHYVMLPALSPAVWSNGNVRHKREHLKTVSHKVHQNLIYTKYPICKQ